MIFGITDWYKFNWTEVLLYSDEDGGDTNFDTWVSRCLYMRINVLGDLD